MYYYVKVENRPGGTRLFLSGEQNVLMAINYAFHKGWGVGVSQYIQDVTPARDWSESCAAMNLWDDCANWHDE